MTNSADRVEVFAGVQRRRRFTAEQKMAFVQEAAQPRMTISFVARRHGIAPSQIFGWRRRMNEGGKEAIRAHTIAARAEIYDPATGTWSPGGTLATPVAGQTATLVQNGVVLLVTGAVTSVQYFGVAQPCL